MLKEPGFKEKMKKQLKSEGKMEELVRMELFFQRVGDVEQLK